MLKRNPFPIIGKVYKYEFKHISKTLVPLFLILLALGLVIGLLQSPMSSYSKTVTENEIIIQGTIDENDLFMNNSDGVLLARNNAMKAFIVIILSFIFSLYIMAVFIVTMVILSGRFKKSMLGDEAYLNLVLPVTMGEHIWGRFLAAVTWVILCFITAGISGMLLMIRNDARKWIPEIIDGVKETGFNAIGMSPALFFTLEIILLFLMVISIILLVYCVNALGHLSQNNKTIVKFLSTIGLFFIMFNIPDWIENLCGNDLSVKANMIISICCYLFMSALYMFTTHLIFTKRLNLE